MKLGRLLRYTVDLDKPILKTILQDFFVTENKNAHTFRIKLMRGGEAIKLSSGSVAAYFTRYKDRFSTPVGGSVEGDEIVVTLSPACYVMRTMFCLTINIPLDDGELCIFAGEGSMLLNREDAIYDPDAEIPSLQDILAQIEATKQAAVAATTAAQSANQAASAATAAAESASKWATAEATATPVSAESQPTVTVAESDGKKVLSFGIPAGKTPNITFSAATGAAGTQVQIQQSGTPENPNIDLTIPRGDTGVHVGPDEPTDPNVNVWIDPDAEDAGDSVTDAKTLGGKPPEYYMPADGTAKDAEKLGGKTLEEVLIAAYPVGSIYISLNDTSPALLFGGTWESLGNSYGSVFLLAASDTHLAGTTGGEETHVLTIEEMPAHTHIENSPSWLDDTTYGFISYEANSHYGSSERASGSAGGGQPHNNMPPFLAVYMWKRVD